MKNWLWRRWCSLCDICPGCEQSLFRITTEGWYYWPHCGTKGCPEALSVEPAKEGA